MSDKSRRARAVERLSEVLLECFDAAVEHGTAQAVSQMNECMDRRDERLDMRMSKQDETLRRQDETLQSLRTQMGRCDETQQMLRAQMGKQDETLRMIWKQAKGEGRLPTDS